MRVIARLIHIGAVFQQEARNFDVAVHARLPKRRGAALADLLHVGLVIEQHACGANVATLAPAHNGEVPFSSAIDESAPPSSKRRAVSAWPNCAARNSGVSRPSSMRPSA